MIKLETLLNNDGEFVKNYILSLDNDLRKTLLKNEKVYKFFLEDKNHKLFIWLINILNEEELRTFFSNDLAFFINTSMVVRKIGSLMNLKLNVKNEILNNDEIICLIFQNEELHFGISKLSGKITQSIFNKIIEENKINLLKKLNKNDLIKLLKNENNIDKIKKIYTNEILFYLPVDTIKELLWDAYFNNKFINLTLTKINELIENGLILPKCIINDELKQKYLDCDNIQERRFYINKLQKNNFYFYDILNKELNENYDNLINNDILINTYSNLLKNSNEDAIKRIMKIVSEQFSEILIDKYFGDFKHNILINLKSIIEFNEKIDKKLISKDRLDLYKLIINFENFDYEVQKEIYNKLPNNIYENLYDDFRICQNYSYELINKDIVDINKLNNREIDGVKIYELNGEDFLLPVHAMEKQRNFDVLWSKEKICSTLSLSLIGDSYLGMFEEPHKNVVVGFKGLDTSSIMHVYHSDSFSTKELSSKRINEVYTPKDLLANTRGYNEILIDDRINIMPDYLICYDYLTIDDIRCSKQLGDLPIILINTQNYKCRKTEIDFDKNDYVQDLQDLFLIETSKIR